MREEIIDDFSGIIEEDAIKKEFAGFWIRVGASFIDTLIFLPFIVFNYYNLSSLKILVLQLLTIAAMTIYKPFMEFKYGATFGKQALNIKVVDEHFKSISLNQALVRYLPWGLTQLVSIIGIFILFNHPSFSETHGFFQVTMLQNSVMPQIYSSAAGLFLLLSCVVVAFSDKKQGIHDIMAKTYCVYK